ncbi:response regulator transcription factor [Gulosibacter molinativorax]|uniref:response regulator transcription factor n=1 Tax=Gulosibacter molinativorax TaxID=256821 RepID=UPI00224062EC|nr:response regulator transcription factor [Gulosibacter molinativorax]QUY60813.1 Transcriptional regulatory protein TcrA [Gulosibacter molinativorax]
MRVLVAEDDERIRSLLERALRESGYSVDAHEDGESALFAAETETVDLLILDIMLPGAINGVEVCRRVRETNPSVPILLLTALSTPRHRVAGLDSGADDYLTKPFHLPELLARVRALLRRSPLAVTPVLSVAGIELDPATHTVARDGNAIDLTAREFAVLELLMRNPGRIVSATEFIDHAWDANYDGYSNVVASTIRHLRGSSLCPGNPRSSRRCAAAATG